MSRPCQGLTCTYFDLKLGFFEIIKLISYRRRRGSESVPVQMYYGILWLLCFTFFRKEVLVIGLKIEEVFVPETEIFGGSATLRCDFHLESDQLLSVKWYKDEHEFFSFRPQRNPPIQHFKVNGVYLQNNSTINAITLTNLTLQADGNYKCEISAERPSYRTLSREGNLTIVVPPDPESPRINNISSTVLMGDTISGNCTSFRSRPHAALTFYINGQKAENSEVIEYRPIVGTWEKLGEPIQLYTSILGLKLQVGHKHFRQGIIKLLCSARIGKLHKELTTELIIRHQNYPDQITRNRNKGGKGLEAGKVGFLLMKGFLCFLFTWINSGL